MDKYEYKVRADEIKELISLGEYAQAAEIADTIDWRRVKSVMMLCTISDLYKINRRYEDARDMLLLAYERRPGGRTICYSLCELSIKMEEYVQAIEYYKEFVQVAPKDSGRYILQYKLYEAQDVSLEERIAVLEELKKRDYREKWAYELAYLYHRVGLAARCVEECDELILWFGDGKYVIKAMELKMLHQPLTADQQAKYDNRFGAPQQEPPVEEEAAVEAIPVVEEMPVAEESFYAEPQSEPEEQLFQEVQEPEIQVKTMDMGQYNTINLQAELAAGLKEVLAEENAASHMEDPITRSIMAPMLDMDTETLDYPEIDEVSEEDLEPEVEEIEDTEVFFGETAEIGDLQQEIILPEESAKEEEQTVSDNTAEMVMEQLRQEITGDTVLHTEPPKELAEVLSQGADGQLSLVMPESENIEKQITGQMNIEDILAEWERMKKENQEKREAEIRQHVLQQTGAMFTEFEAAVRDGLLEKLENEKNMGEAEAAQAEDVLTAEDEVEELEEIADQSILAYEPVEEEAVEAEEAEGAEEAEAAEATAEVEGAEEVEVVAEAEESAEAEEAESAEEAEDAEATAEAEEIVEAEEVAEAVERDRAKVRALTREEKELFGPYIQSRSAREQMVKCIDNISLAAYTGNIVVTGAEGVDTLTLAKNLIRDVQNADSNFSGKVAKISGAALNNKDVAFTVDKLKNGALIITKASEMNEDTVKVLYKCLQQEALGIVIVIEDVKKAMDKFLAAHEQLGESFTARIDVEALSNDTLVAFGKQYAREREYAIDDLGVLALHTRIEELQTIDHVVTVMEVKEIVDEAIRHVKRKTLGHFFDVLFAKRYDDEDMIILSEKDFV